MQVDDTKLLEFINHEVYTEAQKAKAIGAKWIGINIYFSPAELREDGWIATPHVESYSSMSEEEINTYAQENNWRTYQVKLVADVLSEFE